MFEVLLIAAATGAILWLVERSGDPAAVRGRVEEGTTARRTDGS